MNPQTYFVLALAPTLTDEVIAQVRDVLVETGATVETMEWMSSRRRSLGPDCLALKTQMTATAYENARKECRKFSEDEQIDLVIQTETARNRRYRLIAFDMDSTLIQAEVIDELAKMAGVGKEVSAITESAMRGEIDFKQSFTKRLSLLKGLPEELVMTLLGTVRLGEGAERMMANVKAMGLKTAILSGGFSFFAEELRRRLGIDEVRTNTLDVENAVVTGRVRGEIVDGAAKARFLREIAAENGIALEEAVAVGDGANDLPMIQTAGLGIAYRAKPLVRQTAPHSISHVGLDGIPFLLGYCEPE